MMEDALDQPLLNASSTTGRCGPFREYVSTTFRMWWRLTTDRTYLASPLSRRVFWRQYPYAMVVSFAFWAALWWSGLLGTGPIGPTLFETLAELLLISFIARQLPLASLASDFILVICWSPVWYRYTHNLPADSTMAYPIGPLNFFLMWGIGLHTVFVMQFAIVDCVIILMDGRMGPDIQAPLVWIALFTFLIIIPIELQFVSHLNKLQRHLNVSTDGQIIINSRSGKIVSASSGTKELLGDMLAGSELSRIVHASDLEDFVRCLKNSAGQPSEAFLCTMCNRQSQQAETIQEFEARVIPYEVTGPDVHLCLQIVGEVRTDSIEGAARKNWREMNNNHGPDHTIVSVREVEDDACSFAFSSIVEGQSQKIGVGESLPPGAAELSLALLGDDNSCALTVSSASEVSFRTHNTVPRQPTQARKVAVEVQTDPPSLSDAKCGPDEEAEAPVATPEVPTPAVAHSGPFPHNEHQGSGSNGAWPQLQVDGAGADGEAAGVLVSAFSPGAETVQGGQALGRNVCVSPMSPSKLSL